MMGDAYSKAGLSLHIVLRSIRKLWRELKADHVVFVLEGGSWRYDVYPDYKKSRQVAKALASPQDQEDQQVFIETLGELVTFLTEKSNCTVLKTKRVEGDDFIARWVQNHPDDEHVIVSGDTDFIQLLSDKVSIYDGVREVIIKPDGVFNSDGQPMDFGLRSNGHLRVGNELDLLTSDFKIEPEWWRYAMFLKCIRGDSGDGIFSAYPKVRENKIKAAWNDRKDQGYDWNNLMLQSFTLGKGEDAVTKEVRKEYDFNLSLIDLTKQPEDIKDLMDQAIIEAVTKPKVSSVGIHFMRFCDQNGLINIGKEAADHAVYLNAPYVK
jgi:phenolic acid decarboxylase